MRRQKTEPARTVGRASDVYSGLVGLRAETPEECGPVIESIDLSGFEWFGQGIRCPRSETANVIRVNRQGRITIPQGVIYQLGDAPRDERGHGRVLLGAASGAVAIQCVPVDVPRASMLRTRMPGRSVVVSRQFARKLIAAGVELPACLDVVVYPDQRLIYAKLPKQADERGVRQ
jgi:hypothetical protein